MSGIPIPNEDVFWGRVEKRALGECWVWKGAPIKNGYGQYRRKGTRSCYVHRLVYEALVGPIPEGKFLDHLCRNRLCVNPGHLEIVTNRENVLRGVGPTAVNAQKTHCKRGHPLRERICTSTKMVAVIADNVCTSEVVSITYKKVETFT